MGKRCQGTSTWENKGVEVRTVLLISSHPPDSFPPQGFHRVTRPDGHSADVNAGTGGVGQAYLWYHEGPTRGGAIIEVDVIYDDEPVRVPRDSRRRRGRGGED